MECPHCGEQIAPRAKFCPDCGEKLAGAGKAIAATPQRKLRSAAKNSDTLGPEKMLWEGTYSKWAMLGEWIGAINISLVAVGFGLFSGFDAKMWLIMIGSCAVIWAGLLARYFYLRFSRHYALTNQRFTHVRGLLWRQTDRIETIDIDDVAITQGPIERLLGIGTIHLSSSDQSHPELSLPGIENVQIVAGLIDDARRKERRRRGLYIESV
jgi:membrane protein YdbS with pleckstrin-like domain